jgi:hypothetical protein
MYLRALQVLPYLHLPMKRLSACGLMHLRSIYPGRS